MVEGRPLMSVIVPTYNERENMGIVIPRVVSILRRENIPFEILVMDDSSPDDTAGKVEEMTMDYPEVRCIVRTDDRGLSPAVIEGFERARGEILLVMDADLSHPPEALPKLYSKIAVDGCDISVGSRHTKGGGIDNWPLKRKIVSWGASLMARPLTKCSDPMSGFFAIRRRVLEGAPLKAKGYKILLEVLVKGNYSKVAEVPIVFKDREMGESKLGSKVIVNYIEHLIHLYLYPGSAPFFKFLFVGGTGMIVDLGILTLLLFLMGESRTDYMIAQSLSFIAAVTWNYLWNRYWTFKASKGSPSIQYLRFFVVALVAFGIRTFLAYMGVEVLGIDEEPYYQILTIGVIVIVMFINYTGSKLWAFRDG